VQTLLSKNPTYGLTYTTLEGRATVHIANPALFCAAVFHTGSRALSTGQASPAQAAQDFLRRGLPAQAAEAVTAMNLPPDQAPLMREAIRAAAGQAVAAWLSSAGTECTAFDLDAVAEPDRTPCAGCGSAVAPTGYAHFHRTISLIYLRFTARKEGNFLRPLRLEGERRLQQRDAGCGLVGDHWPGPDADLLFPEPLLSDTHRDRAESRAASGAFGHRE